ncbi:MAG: DNA repair protein RadA [Planctomycetes bacterium]|nr:DNA repair protein RadA [Planctomycetota bacterium]
MRELRADVTNASGPETRIGAVAKQRSQFLCGQCGAVHPKWMGKCPDCGAWDALERFIEAKPAPGALTGPGGSPESTAAVAEPLGQVQAASVPRVPSGVAEFDRVLGGGFVPGSAVLLGGDPGIGKSTLLLQALAELADAGSPVLYASSEESAHQVRLRAERIGRGATAERASNLWVLAETNLARLLEQARKVQPAVLVVDSIQLVHRVDVDAVPGSASQLRRCALDLVSHAKTTGCVVVIVGHVTKDGLLAGPRLLEHLVDVVLSFEGDRHHAHRVVRAIKNRFGSTFEVGLFEMTGSGLQQVDENQLAADPNLAPRPGSVAVPALAGSRCLLAEVQALTATGILGGAKRKASGLDGNRLAMLLAVLEQHGGLRLADQDVYASAAGGVKLLEPGTDLAVALAVAAARTGRTPPAAFAAIGEVGLTGQIRPCSHLEQRLAAAARRGVKCLALPAGQVPSRMSGLKMELWPVAHIRQALEFLQPVKSGPKTMTDRKVRSSTD